MEALQLLLEQVGIAHSHLDAFVQWMVRRCLPPLQTVLKLERHSQFRRFSFHEASWKNESPPEFGGPGGLEFKQDRFAQANAVAP
jgi:hypothetical protein